MDTRITGVVPPADGAAALTFVGGRKRECPVPCSSWGVYGGFGRDAIAGYGLASRLDYLLIPLLFALGTASVTMVGTSIGAGRHARARKVAWTGAAISAAITGVIGLVAALFPEAWLHLFSREEEVVRIGSAYLVRVAPLYVFTGLGMALYFAGQGAGRVTWPFVAGVARLSIVLVLGEYWIHVAHGSLAGLFWVVAMSQIAFGTINAFAMANQLTVKSSVTGHRRAQSTSSQTWPRRVLQEQEGG